jgi:hypothetical protein
MTNIVSGAVVTINDLGKDEAWMSTWLAEEPSRLGLGELSAADGDEDGDASTFVATDEDRCFSVDVQLGELEPSRGFGVLDHWARNRVRHPDKSHVAVLVTEVVSDRYQTTLETLAEHLPLVVIELQAWKGENEAIVVPHIALSSQDVDLSDTPAAKAAEAVARTREMVAEEARSTEDVPDEDEALEAMTEDEALAAEADADMADEGDVETADEAEAPRDKDDTGVGNPWGLPQDEDPESAFQASGAGSTGLLSKVS